VRVCVLGRGLLPYGRTFNLANLKIEAGLDLPVQLPGHGPVRFNRVREEQQIGGLLVRAGFDNLRFDSSDHG
jgi:hypothetical protein